MVEFEFDVDWPRTAWLGLGAVLVAALLYIAYRFVGTLVFGLFIYYATRRLYRRIRERVGQPSVAAGLSLVGLALPAVLLLGYTLVVALKQLDAVLGELDAAEEGSQLDQLLDAAEPYRDLPTVLNDPGAVLTNIGGMETVTAVIESLLSYLGVLGTGLLHLFVMFALAFYLLRDGRRFARWSAGLTEERGVFREFAVEVDESFDKVFYGNILNAIITGVIGAIVFSLLNTVSPPTVGVPYAALVGLLAGAASLIPIVGMKLVYVPMTAYLAVLAATSGEGWWFVALFGAVSFVVVDVIPDLLVRPYVSGGKLHTGALMFAYILGPLVFGWYGIFLGPIILVFVSHFARIVLPELLAPGSVQGDGAPVPAMAEQDDTHPGPDGDPDIDESPSGA